MGKLLLPQATLFHAPIEKDVVYTPQWLARLIVDHFEPAGSCLDPCRGDGAFWSLLPTGAQWCEIAEDRDFFAFGGRVDYAIGNPPYSCLLGWIRHSFKVANNVIYLMPLHRVFASFEFMAEIANYGGIKEIMLVGTGADAGFPFGHALGCVHYQRSYRGPTVWSYRDGLTVRRNASNDEDSGSASHYVDATCPPGARVDLEAGEAMPASSEPNGQGTSSEAESAARGMKKE